MRESDLALIEALQVDPRAPWTRIASAVGIDATTAARRWARISSLGLAWLTAYPTVPATVVGYLDLACRPDILTAVADELCRHPSVFSVECTTGQHQLRLSLIANDLAALDDLVSTTLGRLPGITATHLAIATRLYREGSGWLVHALTPQQRTALRACPAAPRPATAARWEGAEAAALVRSLNADARRSYADLARDCGMSESAVRRRVNRLATTHELLFRCDIANGLAGWPVIATYYANVRSDLMDQTGRALAALPDTRLCVAVAGDHNLIISAWLPNPAGCADFEARMAACQPLLEITNRSISTRTRKRMGRLLGPQGVSIGHIPITSAA
ncbi:AsnC family transcriptional regulator [Actinokineospora sp. NBRC 105648]|nr:AsnC family transcriptional regulator [Actinokineospora sp. NBRC 105648]